jgi:dTDP-4-amino-4,6-dideoxygalactose transaminase
MSVVGAIPQANPRASFQERREEIRIATDRVLDSGRYILGSECEAFEQEFASHRGFSHGVGVASGTDALTLALRAVGVAPGDGVITVSNTAVATVAAIELVGATPLLVDVDPARFTMDPERLESLIRELSKAGSGVIPKAIVPVHLYGQMADMSAIMDVAARHGLIVVEDCAQAHGADLDGRPAGTWGVCGCFSFYPTKNLPAMGDGGLIATSDSDIAESVRRLRQYGWVERCESQTVGTNSRLDELQAAILRVNLRYLKRDNDRRRVIADRYDSGLPKSVATPKRAMNSTHAFHQYVVQVEGRDAFREHLSDGAIGTLIHYPVPVHLQGAYRGRLLGGESLPVTESLAHRIVSLPIFPQLALADVDRVTLRSAEWSVASVEVGVAGR